MTWVGDLSALFSWTPPGAAEPAITLNEGAFRILEISGLRSLGEIEANADARVGAIGENARPSQRRGKSLAITGRIIASSMLELDELVSELLAAFADGSREGRMDVAPHPDNAELAAVTPKFFEARALSCDVIDKQATKSFTRTFVVGLRAGDPRIFDNETLTDSCTIAMTNQAQALNVSGDPGIGGVRGPYLELVLPTQSEPSKLIVRNLTTGKSLTIDVPAGWASGNLTLNFGARTVTDGGGTDRSSLLDPADLSLWESRLAISVGDELEAEALAQAVEVVKSPGTVEDKAGVGTFAWTNPGNAKTSNNSYAFVEFTTAGQTSHYLLAKNFGFAVPVGAKILGISPRVERSVNNSAPPWVEDFALKLLKGGVIGAANRAVTGKGWEESDHVVKYGGPGDLFDQAVTVADVNGGEFGFVFAAIRAAAGGVLNREVLVDALSMAVFYSPSQAYGAKATLRWEKGYF